MFESTCAPLSYTPFYFHMKLIFLKCDFSKVTKNVLFVSEIFKKIRKQRQLSYVLPNWKIELKLKVMFKNKKIIAVFIYSLPSSGSSIKERMLYSSCKGPFLSAAQNQYGVVITNKVSIFSCKKIDAENSVSAKTE